MEAKNIRDCRGAANHRHFSFVKVVEWRQLFSLLKACADDPGGIGAALNRHLGNAGERLPVLSVRECQITDDENIRIARHRQIRIDLYASTAIRIRFCPLRELSAK